MILGLRGCACGSTHPGVRFPPAPPGASACARCFGLRYTEPGPGGWTLADGMVGRSYLEAGRCVTVLARWFDGGRRGVPRNVVIMRENGTTVVRPFRGLRRLPA